MPRILFVEDDKDVRLLVEHVLLRERYEVDAAATLAAGPILLPRNRFDPGLADAPLPDGNGKQLGGETKRPRTPALIMTAHAFRFGDELLRFEVLLKPVRPAELLQALGRSLGVASPR